MHEEFMKYGTEMVRLIEECSEVQKVCCKIERFGLDDWNPLDSKKKTNRVKIEEELQDLEFAIKNMREYVNSIPEGTQRYRPDEKIERQCIDCKHCNEWKLDYFICKVREVSVMPYEKEPCVLWEKK